MLNVQDHKRPCFNVLSPLCSLITSFIGNNFFGFPISHIFAVMPFKATASRIMLLSSIVVLSLLYASIYDRDNDKASSSAKPSHAIHYVSLGDEVFSGCCFAIYETIYLLAHVFKSD